jgi:hypothetical protein
MSIDMALDSEGPDQSPTSPTFTRSRIRIRVPEVCYKERQRFLADTHFKSIPSDYGFNDDRVRISGRGRLSCMLRGFRAHRP